MSDWVADAITFYYDLSCRHCKTITPTMGGELPICEKCKQMIAYRHKTENIHATKKLTQL